MNVNIAQTGKAAAQARKCKQLAELAPNCDSLAQDILALDHHADGVNFNQDKGLIALSRVKIPGGHDGELGKFEEAVSGQVSLDSKGGVDHFLLCGGNDQTWEMSHKQGFLGLPHDRKEYTLKCTDPDNWTADVEARVTVNQDNEDMRFSYNVYYAGDGSYHG